MLCELFVKRAAASQRGAAAVSKPFFCFKANRQARFCACRVYSRRASSQHTVAPRAPPAAYTGAGIFRHARRQPEERLR